MKTRILFVCTGNRDRSPTAEALYKWHPKLEVKSVGTSPGANTALTEGLLKWADAVVVMERGHETHIRKNFSGAVDKPIYCLEIPDAYRSMSGELIRIIEERMGPLLPSLAAILSRP